MLDNRYKIDLLPHLDCRFARGISKEIRKLKRFIGYAAILALLSAPAFAAKNSGRINLQTPVTVGTTKLPAAEYTVTWSEIGSNAKVTLSHGKTVVTVPAKVVEQKHDTTSIQTNEKGGTSILLGIDLKDVSVEFAPSKGSGE
jgi:hypothetical protein